MNGRGLAQFLGQDAFSNEAALRRMQVIANLLDSAFLIPGTRQRIGIDAIVGLIPGLGDLLTTLLSTYIIVEARNLGVSRTCLLRMLANLGIHATIGSLPLVGDAFDAFFRVNQRNMRIIRSQLGADLRRS
jgi:hypothetical protein